MADSDNGTVAGGRSKGARGAGTSSRARFRHYLANRRTAAADPAAPGGAAAPVHTDPNHPDRTRRNRPFRVLAREFWGMLAGHRALVVASICTVTVSALAALAMPAATKVALDYILTDNPGPAGLPEWVRRLTTDRRQLLWWLGGALIALNLVSIGVGIWGRWNMTRLGQILRARVRRRVFDHAVRLPLHRVYALKSGGAASLLREDAGQAANLVFSMLYNPWRAVVQLIGTLCVLAWVDWRLLLGALALIPAAWFSQKTWIGRIRPIHRDVRQTRQTIDAHATEAFGGMRIVRGFGRERGEAARFIRNNHLLSRQEILAWWWSRFIEIVWTVMLPAGSVAVLLYGGSRVIDGTLTLGDVMMFSAYLMMLLGPLEALSVSATSIQAELASMDRILDLLDEPIEFERRGEAGGGLLSGAGVPPASRRRSRITQGAEHRPQSGGPEARPTHGSWGSRLITDESAERLRRREGVRVEPAAVAGAISMQGVGFRYPNAEDWVLRDIDLEIAPGQTVALVGPSGAGKTTLCNLVARFYDPTAGRILLDGRDVRDIDVDSYRGLLGIVEQDVFLFDGTVRENIGYARRGAAPEEIRAAARAANADGFIARLERGYDTLIGERGVRLSGGQKQRIAIARALLADPRILILDEATSNLDSESEALIQDSLRDLMRGRTCFVIAHRLSTIRHADLIVVLEGGRIVEKGTHAQLVEREGRYWQMLQRQFARRAESQNEWVEPTT